MAKVYTPRTAAPLLNMHAKTVRDLCASRRIDCIVTFGPKGQARYRLTEDQINSYWRSHTVRKRVA